MTRQGSRDLQIAAIGLAAIFFAAKIAEPPRLAGAAPQAPDATEPKPTFYRDVLPILQTNCQSCHRAGGISALPLETFEQAQRKASAIADSVANRAMPPWFADPKIGRFSNDPSLSEKEIAAFAAWSEAGAPAGDPRDAPPPRHWNAGGD